MREFDLLLREELLGGLRREHWNPRTARGLTECHNIEPLEQGYRVHEYITDLNDSASFGDDFAPDSCGTRTVILNVNDYITTDDIEGVSVWMDDVLQGTTDGNGDITLTGVTIGAHSIRLTKTAYLDSDADDLANDWINVI
jgi:hypothetical protein